MMMMIKVLITGKLLYVSEKVGFRKSSETIKKKKIHKNTFYWVFVNRIRCKISFQRFLLGREWKCHSEGKEKLHSHLHFNKKLLSAAQYYKDVIKITLLLDDWLGIQALFYKIWQDRLHKRLMDAVNTLPQSTGISKLVSPVTKNMEVEGN